MPSDQVVLSKDVLQALMEVRRLGRQQVMEQLEALEPDLMEFALEELTAVHRRMADLGWRPKDVRGLARRVEVMALVLVTAMRKASLRLWNPDAAPEKDPSDGRAGGGIPPHPHPAEDTSGGPDGAEARHREAGGEGGEEHA